MFAAFKTMNLPSKQTIIPRRRFLTRIFLGLRNLDHNLFNALRRLRFLTSLKRTIKTIGAIEEADVIMALIDQDF